MFRTQKVDWGVTVFIKCHHQGKLLFGTKLRRIFSWSEMEEIVWSSHVVLFFKKAPFYVHICSFMSLNISVSLKIPGECVG